MPVRSVRGFGDPLFKDVLVRFDEVLFSELALFDSQLASFLSVIDDLRQRVVLGLQTWLIELSCHRVGVIDLGAVDPLERFHRADGTDQFEIGVVAQQVAKEVESQWSHALGRHEKANLHPHFCKVQVGR